MSIEIRNLPYFDTADFFKFSADQSDETQTPQVAIVYQGATYRTGLPVFPSTNFESVTQPGNAFKIGDAVLKQSDGSYALAQAATETNETTAPDHDSTGIVTVFCSGSPFDKFTVTFSGRAVIGGVAGGRYETSLDTGSIYYLTSGTPGLGSTAYPAGRQTYRPLFVALSSTEAYIIDTPATIPSGRFLDLVDVPASYSGQANKLVRVNGAGTALEFFASPAGFGGAFLNLSDVPASYAGAANKAVAVNSAANGLTFVPSGAQFLTTPVLVYAPPGFSGVIAEDLLPVSVSGAQSSAAATTVADTLYNAVTTGGIPSGARAVILESASRESGPDNVNGLSYIYIRKSLTDPKLLLLAGCARGGGDNVMSSNQGIYPIAADGSFYFSKAGLSMSLGWYILLVGYVY